jgi:hypothetical protein
MNEGEYGGRIFVLIYENRRMKPVEIVLRKELMGRRGRMMEGVSLRYIVSAYVNITCIPSAHFFFLPVLGSNSGLITR